MCVQYYGVIDGRLTNNAQHSEKRGRILIIKSMKYTRTRNSNHLYNRGLESSISKTSFGATGTTGSCLDAGSMCAQNKNNGHLCWIDPSHFSVASVEP